MIDLETKVAYQEKTIQDLNEVVCGQQQQIDQLAGTCTHLVDRLNSVEEMAADGSPPVEKPPHY